MSASATTTARTQDRTRRAAGAGALVFLTLLVVQNLTRAGEPGFGADPASVGRYFAGHRAAILVPLTLFPVGMVSLLCFVAGLRRLADSARDRFWADLGTLAVVVVAALFALVNVVEIAMAGVHQATLRTAPVVAALWAIHGAAFGLNLAAIAIALLGLSRLARRHRLVPPWIGVLAAVGAACLFVAAVGTVSIVEGGPLLYLGLAGFAAWCLFLLTCGLGLLRDPFRHEPAPPSGGASTKEIR